MLDIFQESIEFHRKYKGKLNIDLRFPIKTTHDLSLAYSPGVAGPCLAIKNDPSEIYNLTIKNNTVAIITDGSAVLGLGNIGADASLPVMEGKALLFKEYAGIDAFPICIQTQDTQEIINIIKNITTPFAGINLEDISAPRCFEIENALQDIGIPVFHDDQHGTAIVTVAALLNASKVLNKPIYEFRIVLNGAGAAGVAIVDLLMHLIETEIGQPIQNIVVCDTKGIISKSRTDLVGNPSKIKLAEKTNRPGMTGSLADAMVGADVFIGVSVENAVTKEMVRSMNPNPVILAMANPIPEIMPQDAYDAGAKIVGTGRSDFPNQVNNVLAFPGIFRGAIDAKADRITVDMKMAAAKALAATIENPSADRILPSTLDKTVAYKIADAVKAAYLNSVKTPQ